MTNPLYTIVTPVLNLGSTLELLLRSLKAQEFPQDQFECIVVDDGSTDGSAAILRDYQGPVQLKAIFNTVNRGRSQARNLGWRSARGEFVIFLDGDMLPAPGWLQGYEDVRVHGRHDVMSGGRYCLNVTAGRKDRREWFARLAGVEPNDFLVADPPEQFRRIHRSAFLGQYPFPIFKKLELQLREVCGACPESPICGYSLITSNVAVRREWLEKTSGFDPFLRRAEDSDLGLRLWELGARFGFADDARAYHPYDASQPDRGITPAEHVAFFYRHPYRVVLLVYLWSVYNSPAAINPGPPFGGSLLELARLGACAETIDFNQHFNRLFKRSVPADCQYTKEFLADYFSELYGVSPPQVREYLDQALSRGLFAVEREGTIYFDVYHTTNWLRYRTSFEDHCLRFSSYGRTHKTRFQLTGDPDDLSSLAFRGACEIHVPADIAPEDVDVSVNLPVPVEDRCQSGVRLTAFYPPGLINYYDPAKGMITGFPLKEFRRHGVTIGYAFECVVHEFTARNGGPPPGAPETAGFLQPSLPAEYIPKARDLLKKMDLESDCDCRDIARRIYFWILNNTVFVESPFPDFFFFDTGFGSCVHQSSVFVNFCRLMGIPARERSGGLLAKIPALDSACVETRTVGYSPLSHTWAEFYSPAQGWTPVDFVGWGYGARLLTGLNVTSETLRSELARDTTLYDNYYFGSIDPYRIYTAAGANKAPTYSFGAAKRDAGMRWRHELLSRTRHALTCRVISREVEEYGAARAGMRDWSGRQGEFQGEQK